MKNITEFFFKKNFSYKVDSIGLNVKCCEISCFKDHVPCAQSEYRSAGNYGLNRWHSQVFVKSRKRCVRVLKRRKRRLVFIIRD